jgi:hypothetical protein
MCKKIGIHDDITIPDIIMHYYENNKKKRKLSLHLPFYNILMTYSNEWIMELSSLNHYKYIPIFFEYNYKYIFQYFNCIKKEIYAIKIQRWIKHHLYKPNGILWNKILNMLNVDFVSLNKKN